MPLIHMPLPRDAATSLFIDYRCRSYATFLPPRRRCQELPPPAPPPLTDIAAAAAAYDTVTMPLRC